MREALDKGRLEVVALRDQQRNMDADAKELARSIQLLESENFGLQRENVGLKKQNSGEFGA